MSLGSMEGSELIKFSFFVYSPKGLLPVVDAVISLSLSVRRPNWHRILARARIRFQPGRRILSTRGSRIPDPPLTDPPRGNFSSDSFSPSSILIVSANSKQRKTNEGAHRRIHYLPQMQNFFQTLTPRVYFSRNLRGEKVLREYNFSPTHRAINHTAAEEGLQRRAFEGALFKIGI